MLTMPFIVETPSALLGLFSLLIPLVIHLLSKARPRIIAFAHIAFIKVKTSPKLRQLRLTQFILLALRLLILLLATLILAQMYWQDSKPDLNSHILLTEDWLNHATNTEKQRLIAQLGDSNLVLLSTKNRNIDKTDIAQWPTNHLQTPALNIWSKVADYLASQSSESAISVYTTNRLKQFIGKQIPLAKQVKWHVKEVPIENITDPYSANITVIVDDASSILVVYLRAAFEAINSHKNLNINVNYISYEELIKESVYSPSENITINLSEHDFDNLKQSSLITQAELNDVKQVDFVLTLARLLFPSQSQTWWVENTRLSTQQIVQSSSKSAVLDKAKTHKKSPSKMPGTSSLHIWLILILVSVFILERILSEWPNSRVKTKFGE